MDDSQPWKGSEIDAGTVGLWSENPSDETSVQKSLEK